MKTMLQQNGFVLVFALLYLSVLTLIIAAAFSHSLLQSKMIQNLHDASVALQNAESALSVAEQSIQGDENHGEGWLTENARYSFHRQAENECEVMYQVNATGLFVKARSNLQSLIQVPKAVAADCPVLLRRRIYWLEVQ